MRIFTIEKCFTYISLLFIISESKANKYSLLLNLNFFNKEASLNYKKDIYGVTIFTLRIFTKILLIHNTPSKI